FPASAGEWVCVPSVAFSRDVVPLDVFDYHAPWITGKIYAAGLIQLLRCGIRVHRHVAQQQLGTIRRLRNGLDSTVVRAIVRGVANEHRTGGVRVEQQPPDVEVARLAGDP